jgi:hypothetical protein
MPLLGLFECLLFSYQPEKYVPFLDKRSSVAKFLNACHFGINQILANFECLVLQFLV